MIPKEMVQLGGEANNPDRCEPWTAGLSSGNAVPGERYMSSVKLNLEAAVDELALGRNYPGA